MNRQGFIGGSDARRIMEGDWHNLWLEKTGRAKSADLSENIAVQLGVWTEAFNVMWFKRHHIGFPDSRSDNMCSEKVFPVLFLKKRENAESDILTILATSLRDGEAKKFLCK